MADDITAAALMRRPVKKEQTSETAGEQASTAQQQQETETATTPSHNGHQQEQGSGNADTNKRVVSEGQNEQEKESEEEAIQKLTPTPLNFIKPKEEEEWDDF